MKRKTRRETSRFWEKVRLPREGDGCMTWRAYTNRWGYGQFTNKDRKHVYAHRYSYVRAWGPIPEGFQVDHVCGTTNCVRPDHLEAVPGRENNARSQSPSAENSRKTECPQGHPYDEKNTYVERDGHRACRTCRRAAHRAWKERNNV